MRKLAIAFTVASATVLSAGQPAAAGSFILRKPTASIVTEGIIVACNFKSNRVAKEIVVSQLKMLGQATSNVKLSRHFCDAFLKKAKQVSPTFVKAVLARVRAAGTNANNDPAVASAKKGKKEETTTTTTTSGDTTTTVTTTVETTTNENGSTTITETITIKQS